MQLCIITRRNPFFQMLIVVFRRRPVFLIPVFCVFFCHTDTLIRRYTDRCSCLLAIAMTSSQLSEVVIGFADPPPPQKRSILSSKFWCDKHRLWQASMPVIPVNPNHPTASAAHKRTPSVAVHESPPRAAKIRVNNALVHGASASAPRIAMDAGNGAGLANAHVVSVAAFAAAAGSVAAPAHSDDSSTSSESDLDIIGGGCTASGQKSTGMPELSDQQPL
jgi:hypothetical protein